MFVLLEGERRKRRQEAETSSTRQSYSILYNLERLDTFQEYCTVNFVKKKSMNQQRISSSISQEEWINISSKKRFHPEQKMVTELDLHGYTKEKAVSTTTWFLDDAMKKAKIRKESPVFVTIITGTGKHSHCGKY